MPTRTRRASLVNLRDVPPRRFIIYPENNTYRMLQHFLVLLSLYTCSLSLFLKTFIAPLPVYAVIIESIINGFFMLDIVLFFFVAYVDKKTLAVVDDRKKIAMNAARTVFLRISLIMVFPFELIGMQFHPSTRAYWILTALCFFRLFRASRVHHFFSELEENGNFNFTRVRLAKMILVCLFVCHYGGCLFYFIATLHGDPDGTWLALADPHFLETSSIKQYINSIYWAVTSFTTVGFGDLHAVTIWEKMFSIAFLFHNILVAAFVLAPYVGPTGRYRARRLRVLGFCRQHNLPTHLRDEVSAHLELEYVFKLEPSEEHGIFKSLSLPIRGMILKYLYNNYVMNNHLFAGISDATRFQLVLGMEPVIFPTNITVILQDEFPTCFYFLVRGSVQLISFIDGVDTDAGTVQAGDVFGESCVLSNKPQLFTVKTRKVCHLLKLERVTLFEILQHHPIDRSKVMQNQINLLKELNNPDTIEILHGIERRKAHEDEEIS